MLRHHYLVYTRSEGAEDGGDRRTFHLFAEAEEEFNRRQSEAQEKGMKVASSSYWRLHFSPADGSGTGVKLALDDIGLTACDEALEGS